MFIKYLAPYINYTKIDLAKSITNTTYGEWIKVYYSDGCTSEIKIGVCYDFYFDVNGYRKPNKFGYDQFVI